MVLTNDEGRSPTATRDGRVAGEQYVLRKKSQKLLRELLHSMSTELYVEPWRNYEK